jgi:uncharacterized protein (TIGR02285 family)
MLSLRLSALLRALPGLFLALGLPFAHAQVVKVEYRDKPPYSHTERGKPVGFLIERTIEIFRLAKVDADYLEVPVKRILMDIEADQAPICSPSWYKLPEREKFARFSLPIHQDKPHVVLAHAQAAKAIQRHGRLAALFADPQLTLGVLDGVSYGLELDQAMANTGRPAVRARLTPVQLARMISAQRADYMLIDQEDLGWLRQDPEFAGLNLVRIDFADMPPGLLRYLMCSRQVEPATLDRLNQAIRQLLPALVGRP